MTYWLCNQRIANVMPMQPNLLSATRFSVFRVPEALSNWRAVVAIAAGAIAFALLVFVARDLPGIASAILMVVGVIAYLSGLSGAGACLLDQARSNPPASVPTYLMRGLFSLPRLLGVLVLMLLAFLLVGAVVGVYLFFCKIPVLGPLLLAIGIPLLVAVVAAALAGIYVMTTLAGPAVWDGHGVLTAFRASVEILRHHTWPALSKIVGGFLLAVFLSTLFLGFVFWAAGVVAVLAGAILNVPLGMPGMSMLVGGGFSGGYEGLLVAGTAGFGFVLFISMALASLTPCMVAILTWLEFSEKVDLVAARTEAEAAVETLRQKSRDLQDKYAAAATPQRRKCSLCGADQTPDDKFCGSCGAAATTE